jgi:hypothetical protein
LIVVEEILDGGKLYQIKNSGEYTRRGDTAYEENHTVVSWLDLLPYRSPDENTVNDLCLFFCYVGLSLVPN